MRRNSEHRFCSVAVAFQNAALMFVVLLLTAPSSFAQDFTVKPVYQIVSATQDEIVLHVHPDYTTQTVTDPVTSEAYTAVSFSGATSGKLRQGSPAEQLIQLSVLVPSLNASASYEIISKQTQQISGVLAPVAKPVSRGGVIEPQYIRDAEQYGAHAKSELVAFATPQLYRTAYLSDITIHPISYDLDNSSITIVTDLVIRIKLPKTPHSSTKTITSTQEAELFGAMCLNGNNSSLYHSAVPAISRSIASTQIAYKNSVAGAGAEQWFSITTNEEGVYRLTANDLSKAGGASIDGSTLAIYGYGAQALPEDVDSLSGELKECTIDVRTNDDGSFSEVRFFSAGPAEWHYDPNAGGSSPIYRLYHLMNAFSTSGHFLLKVGGAVAQKRIATQPDVVADSILTVQKSTVQTVVLHENERAFENPNVSREFVGEQIPVGRDATITLPDMPGYTGDSTVIRPAYNSHAFEQRTFNASLNGSLLGSTLDQSTIQANSDATYYTIRRWDSEFLVAPSRGVPTTMTFTATTNELSPGFWLNWVETFYRRETNLSSGSVPFMIFGDASVYRYNFTSASNGEIWDVTDPTSVRRIAIASSDAIDVKIKGDAKNVRRFMAFTTSQLKSASVAGIASPSLRSGICSQGAQEIIVTPQAFLEEATALAKQRRMGGQATEPLSVAIVTVEDIYREFGYGANDLTAIRNFSKAAMTRSASSGGIVPLYICFFGGGHCDYQNRTTQIPVRIPIYETWNSYSVGSLRSSEPEYVSDDAFYVQLTPNSERMDIAIGRITVATNDEAAAFVSKVVKYETSSDQGAWRAKGTYIADDRYHEDLKRPDGLVHIYDTERELEGVADRFIVRKMYGQSYPNVFTASGRKKPQMEQDIVDAFNSGSAIISYIGHGNPAIWADESILAVPSTINKMTNLNRLAFLTTATCDFSTFDDYAAKTSGGVQLLKKPDGGAIAMLATCRSVQGGDPLVNYFYKALFNLPCDIKQGTAPIGLCYVVSRPHGYDYDKSKYMILGDPAQRVIIPRQYVSIDSINGVAYDKSANAPITLAALSLVNISGHISNNCDGYDIDQTFNGSTNITLYDAPTTVTTTTTFTEAPPITDVWKTNGPILYSGVASVNSGRFNTQFVVSKDIKFDSNQAKISMLAYSDDFRSALGVAKNLKVFGIDTTRINEDHTGPGLTVYIGSRRFKSGDIVPINSLVIVDVRDLSGLNTSSSGVGHSFVGWTDDSTTGAFDLAEHYVALPNDFTQGTSTTQAVLPVGKHTLRVRAFDAAGNASFGEVEFIAQGDHPYQLFNVTIVPHPISTTATFTFEQPAAPESPVDVALDIYSAIGQHVRTISLSSVSSNSVVLPFDGNDDGGSSLLNGMYIYRLTATQRLSGVSTSSGGTFLILHQQ